MTDAATIHAVDRKTVGEKGEPMPRKSEKPNPGKPDSEGEATATAHHESSGKGIAVNYPAATAEVGHAGFVLDLALGMGLALQDAVANLRNSYLVTQAANAQILAQALAGERRPEDLQQMLTLSQSNVERQLTNMEIMGQKAIELLRQAVEALVKGGAGS